MSLFSKASGLDLASSSHDTENHRKSNMTAIKENATDRLADSYSKFSYLRYEDLLAGVLGGVTSTLILHPLDLIKIRFAVNDGRSKHTREYKNIFDAFKVIIKEEGFRGLYRGVNANVWGSGSSWGLYFLYYKAVKTWLQGGRADEPLGAVVEFFAAAQAGVFTLMMTNPIWVVKTRLCLQMGEAKSNNAQTYNGMVDGLTKIFRQEGVRGLYKGFVPGLFGVSHGSIQFMVYEQLKSNYNIRNNKPVNEKMSVSSYLSFAAISKLTAAAITYPYQVVRARLQDHNHSYKGTLDCIKKIYRYERFWGFYKGFVPYFVHVFPNVCLILLIREEVTKD